MDIIIIDIVAPILFYIFCRAFNAQGNHYLTVKEKSRENDLYKTGRTKFYKMGKFRFVLVSVSCYEEYVARRVIVMSIICLANTFLALITALIAYLTDLQFLVYIFCATSIIFAIVAMSFAGLDYTLRYDNCRSEQNKKNKK